MITPMCAQLTYEGLIDEVCHSNLFFFDVSLEANEIINAFLRIWAYTRPSFVFGFPLQFLGISNGSVELESSMIGGKDGTKKVKLPLNSRYAPVTLPSVCG